MKKILITIITASLLSMAAAHTTDSSTPNATDQFIYQTCSCTRYPSLCYHTLLPYADKFKNNPDLIPRVAVSASLSEAKKVALYVRQLAAANSTTSALRDCAEQLVDAVDRIKASVEQLRWLTKSGKGQGFNVSNALTWMSAALTDDDTCEDESESLEEPLRSNVLSRTMEVQKLTSNALALVTNYY